VVKKQEGDQTLMQPQQHAKMTTAQSEELFKPAERIAGFGDDVW